MLEKSFGNWSSLLTGLLTMPFLVVALGAAPGEALAAAAAAAPAKIIVDAEYLGKPESWQPGAVILQLADIAVLQATDGSDVKLLGTNRCFSAIPTGEDGTTKLALPPGFYEAQGESPHDIYNRIVNQDNAIFLASVRGPLIADPRVADFNCYLLTFAYKAKPTK